MIDPDLPVCRRAKALGVSRSAVYCQPRAVSAADLQIMRPDEAYFDRSPLAAAA